MSTTYIITRFSDIPLGRNKNAAPSDGELCCCLLEDEKLVEVNIDSEGQSLLGNVYVGKVKNVLKNINAAFVEIAGRQTCFLSMTEAKHPVLTNRTFDGRILSGDEILVQVKKDAAKTKDPVLTANLSLTGIYVSVSMGTKREIHYSHKLSEEAKKQLKEMLRDVAIPPSTNVVIRTRAQELLEDGIDFSLLQKELAGLSAQLDRILQLGKTRTVFSCLTENVPGYVKRLQTAGFPDKIVTDVLSVYQTLQSFFGDGADAPLCDRITFYRQETLSLSSLYGLAGRLSEAVQKNVWLKSGGYLVVEQTEALTVIDVNTGKYVGKKGSEETFWLINEEAALEVARQLRLRNLSGIIVVDFINMTRKETQNRLLAFLRNACCRDPIPVQVMDITALGLVEIVRKKAAPPLSEQLKRRMNE